MIKGVEKNKLQMMEYDPSWAEEGKRLEEIVRTVMGDDALAVRHVGSTSIPGMYAKPIIDIAVLVDDLDIVERYADAFKEQGIIYVGEYIEGQRELYIDSSETGNRLCHIHVTRKGSVQWDDYNNIVDYVCEFPHERQAYINIKRELIAKYADEPSKYGPAKKEFMEALITRAREWRNRADKIAVVDKDGSRSITYGELEAMINFAAGKLSSKGFKKGSFIVVKLGRCTEFIAAYFGVIKAGYAVIPMTPDFPKDREASIMEDSEAVFTITEDFFNDADYGKVSPPAFPAVPDEALVLMNYTSGSTGKPKGVIYSMKCLRVNLDRAAKLFDGIDDIVYAASESLTFAAIHATWAALKLGATVHLLSDSVRKDVKLLSRYYETHGITCGGINPMMLRFFTHTSALKRVFAVGQRVTGIYSDEHETYCGYGLTETFTVASYFKIDKPYDNTPIGKPLDNIEIQVLDENGREVPDGTEGEICITGYLSDGYFRRPEETAAVFEKYPDGRSRLHTHDAGYRDAEGNLHYVSRMDWMVKINGNRVELLEVEHAVSGIPGIDTCICKDYVNKDGRAYLCAYYTTSDESFNEESIIKALSDKLPSYMIPSYYVRIDEVPLTISGKPDRSKLSEPNQEDFLNEYIAPRDEKEALVCDAMAEVLSLDRVGIRDDLYKLGGDSMDTIKLSVAINNPALTVADITRARTPEKIAEAIRLSAAAAQFDETECRKRSYELTPYQRHYFDYCRLNKGITIGNTAMQYRFDKGKISPSHLAACTIKVLKRHPAYSSVISDNYGVVMQHCDPAILKSVEIIETTEAEVGALSAAFIRPFDILDEPLVRYCIYVTEESVYLVIDAHHIVSDATSTKIIIGEICDEMDGKSPEKEDVYYSYLEGLKESNNGAKAFSGYDEYSGHLDFDHINMDVKESGMVRTLLNYEDIRDSLEGNGISTYTLLLSSVLVNLSKYNKKPKVKVNTIYTGRDSVAVSNTAGLFITALPITADFDEIKTTGELIHNVEDKEREVILRRNVLEEKFTGRPVVDDTITLNYIPANVMGTDREYTGLISSAMLMKEIKVKTNSLYVIAVEDAERNLRVDIMYSKALYTEESAKKFSDMLITTIKELTL